MSDEGRFSNTVSFVSVPPLLLIVPFPVSIRNSAPLESDELSDCGDASALDSCFFGATLNGDGNKGLILVNVSVRFTLPLLGLLSVTVPSIFIATVLPEVI